jgi:glutamyl-tRNA synthetase
MIAWLRARSLGGRLIMRMEDLDHPRDKPGAAAQAIRDLEWLGFDWDEQYVQSQRKDKYRQALEKLCSLKADDGGALVYPCVCSRRDVENAQSAPHEGEQLHYPGTCRGRFHDWHEAFVAKGGAAPCWRFRVGQGQKVAFEDVFAGRMECDVAATLGDFPVARDEFGAGYTLAVVVDDAAMGVSEVVRGDDLLAATPAQIMLQRALGLPTPAYCHVPLVVGRDGRRLAKRHGDSRIASLRAGGIMPNAIIGMLAASCGWCPDGEHVSLRELLRSFDLGTVPKRPFMI